MKTIAEQLNVKEFPFRIKDSKGRIIYFEESDKRWAKYEHDSEGNVIYYENSNGYWRRAQYDANGSQIYFENSSGEIEDKRPKSCEDGVKYKLNHNSLSAKKVKVADTQTIELQIGGSLDEIEMQKMEIRKTHIIFHEEPVEILMRGVFFQNLKIKQFCKYERNKSPRSTPHK